MIGTVKSFDQNNFSGVIACAQTGEEIPFSLPAIASQHYKTLHPGQKVNFYVEQGAQTAGCRAATKVTAIE
jgi:Cold shock proteins